MNIPVTIDSCTNPSPGLYPGNESTMIVNLIQLTIVVMIYCRHDSVTDKEPKSFDDAREGRDKQFLER